MTSVGRPATNTGRLRNDALGRPTGKGNDCHAENTGSEEDRNRGGTPVLSLHCDVRDRRRCRPWRCSGDSGRDPCGPGSRPEWEQWDDYRPSPVQLWQRRAHLWPGRRVQRVLQRDERRPALQRELLLRRQRIFRRHVGLRSRGRPRHPLRARRQPGTRGLHSETLPMATPSIFLCRCSAIRRRPNAQLRRPASTTRRPSTCHASRALSPGSPSPSSVSNVPIPAHDHVVGTRNGGAPEWWNVEVVATTNPATFNTLTSVGAINAAVTAGTAITAPTNAFLFFQVLPGTLSASMAANLTATAPPGPAVPGAPGAPPASQVEPGTTFNNLMNDCGATAPNCQNVGISRDWIDGQDVEALYTEQYYCGTTSVAVHSSSGCEAGSDPTSVPPGVADTDSANPDRDQQPDRSAVHPGPALCQPAGALCPVLGRQYLHRSPGDDRPLAAGLGARIRPPPRWTTSGCPATTTS